MSKEVDLALLAEAKRILDEKEIPEQVIIKAPPPSWFERLIFREKKE